MDKWILIIRLQCYPVKRVCCDMQQMDNQVIVSDYTQMDCYVVTCNRWTIR